jgi:hypothetical protein
LARLPTAMLLLSAPKPHVGQERNLKRAEVVRDGAKGQMHQHRVGVKSQAENRFQNASSCFVPCLGPDPGSLSTCHLGLTGPGRAVCCENFRQ